MTRAEAEAALADFVALQAAAHRETWHPSEVPPPATCHWIASSSLLLALCRRLLDEGLAEGPLSPP